MTTETTYNPVRKQTLMDKMADFYWTHQKVCDAVFFVVGVPVVAAVAFVLAA